MAHTLISEKITNDPHFTFFSKCIGVLNGSHICAFTSTKDHVYMHNRKGYLSQNCLFACDFNFNFTYVLCGWDGSVSDAALWRDAIMNNIWMPADWYLLGDAGFLSCNAILVPYHGVWYHLREWWEEQVGYVFTLIQPHPN